MDYSVARFKACVTVGYKKYGLIGHTFYICKHPRFGFFIQRPCSLIKQYNRRILP